LWYTIPWHCTICGLLAPDLARHVPGRHLPDALRVAIVDDLQRLAVEARIERAAAVEVAAVDIEAVGLAVRRRRNERQRLRVARIRDVMERPARLHGFALRRPVGIAAARPLAVVADHQDLLGAVHTQVVAAGAGIARDRAQHPHVLRVAHVGDHHVVERGWQAVPAEVRDAVVDPHRVESRAHLAAGPALALGPGRALIELEVAVAEHLEALHRRVLPDLVEREVEHVDAGRHRSVLYLRRRHLCGGAAKRTGRNDDGQCTEQEPPRHVVLPRHPCFARGALRLSADSPEPYSGPHHAGPASTVSRGAMDPLPCRLIEEAFQEQP
jgi:hypothetical protein